MEHKITKAQFISKWECWWILNKRAKELTEAFERELNMLIQQEVENEKRKKENEDANISI